MSTASDKLAKIEAAIEEALNGQTVSWGDRRYTSQNLTELENIRAYYERRVAGENRRALGDYSPSRYQVSDFGGTN